MLIYYYIILLIALLYQHTLFVQLAHTLWIYLSLTLVVLIYHSPPPPRPLFLRPFLTYVVWYTSYTSCLVFSLTLLLLRYHSPLTTLPRFLSSRPLCVIPVILRVWFSLHRVDHSRRHLCWNYHRYVLFSTVQWRLPMVRNCYSPPLPSLANLYPYLLSLINFSFSRFFNFTPIYSSRLFIRWWRSYLSAGSSGGYLFLYSIWYFFTKLNITGTTTTIPSINSFTPVVSSSRC